MTTVHVVPEAAYTLATAERDGLPAVALLNLAYNDFEHCADYPWLLSVTIELENQSDNGLPTDEEADVLNKLEDAIETALAEVTTFHHIARQSWNGMRVLDYYVHAGEEARVCVESLSKAGAVPRKLEAKVERDPKWASWLPMLQAFG
jgi:hypothetical protein